MDSMDTVPSSLHATWLYGALMVVAAFLALLIFIVVRKGRRLPGEHVYQASRWSKGNHLLPAQVQITRDSVTLYQPQWIGKVEESIHMQHVSSIKIDTHMVFSDVFIETTGGRDPIVCHGHTKGDAVKMKQAIEQFQTERYK